MTIQAAFSLCVLVSLTSIPASISFFHIRPVSLTANLEAAKTELGPVILFGSDISPGKPREVRFSSATATKRDHIRHQSCEDRLGNYSVLFPSESVTGNTRNEPYSKFTETSLKRVANAFQPSKALISTIRPMRIFR